MAATTVKATLGVRSLTTNARRLAAARAGLTLQDEYEFTLPINDELVEGLNREGVAELVYLPDDVRAAFLDALIASGGDMAAALEALRQQYRANVEERARYRAQREAEASAEKRREEAKQLLADELQALRKRVEEMTDRFYDEQRKVVRLCEFIQSRRLEADFLAWRAEKTAEPATREFAELFGVAEREEEVEEEE